jgi:outer membrane receptor protein involved in Fe transport
VDYTRAEETSGTFRAAGTPSAPYGPDVAMTTGAAFAELGWTLLDGRLRGTAGARVDRLSLRTEATALRPDIAPGTRSFTSVNPSAGLQYALGDGVRLHATAGRAFVAPTPFASAGLVTSRPSAGLVNITVGNPRLDAESSVTVDAGVAVSRPALGLEADATYFHTQVDGRITSASAVFAEGDRPRTADGDLVGRVTSSVNAGDATMHGVELRAGLDVGALLDRRYSLRLFGNATRLFSATERVRAASLDGSRFAGRTDFEPAEAAAAIVYGAESASRIRNVAGLTATAGIEYDDRRRLDGRLSGRYVSRRLDTDFTDFANVSDIEYPAVMVLDLSAGVRLSSRTRLDLALTNLTDENYYEVRGYPLPGRSVALRMSVWAGGR